VFFLYIGLTVFGKNFRSTEKEENIRRGLLAALLVLVFESMIPIKRVFQISTDKKSMIDNFLYQLLKFYLCW
jgi:hypothetical protein